MKANAKRALLLALLALASAAACGIPQSDECAKWLECQKVLDQEQGTNVAEQYRDAYGEGGSCWLNVESAESCTQYCVEALESMQSFRDLPEACRLPEG